MKLSSREQTDLIVMCNRLTDNQLRFLLKFELALASIQLARHDDGNYHSECAIIVQSEMTRRGVEDE
jgi:hypothetical protein